MRKDFGKKAIITPLPVLIIATYNEDGSANAMNAAWGGQREDDQITICLGTSHKTVENLKKPEIQNAIDERLEQLKSEKTADAQEVIEYLTSVMRGESEGEELINEFVGDGCSKPTKVKKAPSEKDRLRAAELLGKRYGIFTEKTELKANVTSEKLADVFKQIGGEGLEE